MNIKLATSLFAIATAVLPIAGYTADAVTSSPKALAKDSLITTKVKAELAAAKLSSLLHLKVATDDQGVVTLGGTVNTQESADQAVSIARAVAGVSSVQNDIKIVATK